MDAERILSTVVDRILLGETVPVKKEHQKEVEIHLRMYPDSHFTITEDPTSPNRVIIKREHFGGEEAS
jgi:hypothetical protein